MLHQLFSWIIKFLDSIAVFFFAAAKVSTWHRCRVHQWSSIRHSFSIVRFNSIQKSISPLFLTDSDQLNCARYLVYASCQSNVNSFKCPQPSCICLTVHISVRLAFALFLCLYLFIGHSNENMTLSVVVQSNWAISAYSMRCEIDKLAKITVEQPRNRHFDISTIDEPKQRLRWDEAEIHFCQPK